MAKQITKTDAPTLDDLAEMLNAASEARYEWERECLYRDTDGDETPRVDERYDVTSLPVYGDHHPSDTMGIYSWDDTRVLVLDDQRPRPWIVCDTGDYHA